VAGCLSGILDALLTWIAGPPTALLPAIELIVILGAAIAAIVPSRQRAHGGPTSSGWL
jgi:hypothetical protein